jgi:hypothetical protein
MAAVNSTHARMKHVIAVSLPLMMAWVMGTAVPRIWWEPLSERFLRPSLPLVSVPFKADSDVVSLVPFLYRTVELIAWCLLLAEVGKVLAVRWLAGVSRLKVALMIFAFQVLLAVDLLRLNSPDWYGYLLHYLGLVVLDFSVMKPEVLPVPAPWLSLAFLVVLLMTLSRATFQADGRISIEE